jgi:hypothetical protein
MLLLKRIANGEEKRMHLLGSGSVQDFDLTADTVYGSQFLPNKGESLRSLSRDGTR